MITSSGSAKLKLESDEAFKSKSVIVAEGISKSFEADGQRRDVIKDFTLRIQRGDRIGIVGGNGAGKTTLLKMLTGELAPDTGKVTRSNKLSGVMIDQQRTLLEGGKSVREVLAEGGDWIDVRGARKHVQGYLKEFLFDPKIVDTKVANLSGGERSLDEPTNDLDLETLDLLQEVIADYEGTVLIVSHDRDFLDRTVTVTLGLDGTGRVDVVAGGYEPSDAKPSKLSYKDQRDFERLPARIEQLEVAIAKGETILADPDLYTSDPQNAPNIWSMGRAPLSNSRPARASALSVKPPAPKSTPAVCRGMMTAAIGFAIGCNWIKRNSMIRAK